MPGLGTVINTAGILAGGLTGRLLGRFFKERQQEALGMACGICVLFIGIAGVMEGMLGISDGALSSGRSMFIVLCLCIGTVIGEIIDIEGYFTRFGAWLKEKTGNANDKGFVDAFVTASLTVCIGAMAVVGSIQDGILGDASVLALKAVLDFIIISVMTSSMGIGCVFSAIPVLFFEGFMTLLSRLIQPFMTDAAMQNLSLLGSILIFCVGLNQVWGRKVRVANMLPSLLVAILAAFL